MTPDELRERLVQAGLERYADALTGLARPAVRLVPMSSGDSAGDARSRLGGEPDLPPNVEWPSFGGVPLSFVAQIDLADVAPFDVDGRLPSSGLLTFFYDAEMNAWGFDPAHCGAGVVMFTPATSSLDRRPLPADLPKRAHFASVPLHGQADTTYAPWESSDVASLGLSRDELFRYAEVLPEETSPAHRLLGHPEPIQGDMQRECQLVTNGLYIGDGTGYKDPRAEVLQEGAVNWRLLLQVDSDDDAGMMWGDLGRIYYWIREPDLAARAWDTVWSILQCS